ncbi:MAG: dienelactone hydrolase [Nitrospirae bacterium RBG_16_64_22]|nr:MAG: dienelactone hydrolase [Nitrospirae bacterium RBG_16_64_22]
MKRLALAVILLLVLPAAALAEVKGQEVEYRSSDKRMKGYLAFDPAIAGKRPGILVVHEWWGLNEYTRKRARMLAELGYTALALDMYGEGKQVAHPDDAGKLSAEVRKNMPVAKARFTAALELLAKHQSVDSKKIAAIGYCFGGGIVLEMARSGVDLAGVVSFHGSLGTASPARPGAVKAKVLVLNGAADPLVTPEQIEKFKKEMAAARADLKFVSYHGAKHAFTNPDADVIGEKFNMPVAFNAEADKKSWEEMRVFFGRILKTN